MEKLQTVNSIREKYGFEPLTFDQIFYNEPIYYLEQKWNRKLTDHEKHIVIEIYRWTRTNIEAEELKILDIALGGEMQV